MELAMPAVFGKGAGCELVKDTCDAFMKANPAQNYYCQAGRKDGRNTSFWVLQKVLGLFHVNVGPGMKSIWRHGI
jgi:hypothetical protein